MKKKTDMSTISNTSKIDQDRYKEILESTFKTFVSKIWIYFGIKNGYLNKYVRLIDYIRKHI